MNIIHTLKEKIISKLTLEDRKDVERLTITSNVSEQITYAVLLWGFEPVKTGDPVYDPLDGHGLVEKVMTLRITEKGRSRKDIKEVYTGWEFRSDVRQQVSTPRPSEEEVIPRRRWI